MKKVMLTLLVIALAVPAFAADISLVDNGNGTATVKLTATVEEAVRGVAVEVTLTDGTLAGVSGINSAFNVFPDSAWDEEVNGDGYTIGEGTPIAKVGEKGPLAAAGATSFSICMGMLDGTGNQAAFAGGTADLLTLELDCTADVTVAIAADTLRGGIVGDAVVAGTIAGGTVVCGGTPCLGDIDGNGVVDTVDLGDLVIRLGNNAKDVFPGSCAGAGICKYEIAQGEADYDAIFDFDGNGIIDTVDLGEIVILLGNNAKDVFPGSCAGAGICKYEYVCP